MNKTKLQDLFFVSIIQDKISLTPIEINNNINEQILDKIKKKIGNKCYKQGFIDINSIKLLERSIGKIKSSHFNGNLIFNIKIEVQICNPLQGDIIKCKVIGKNKMGILATNYPLVIALSKMHHDDLSIFDKINENDEIYVEVICSKFELNDTEIDVIAKFSRFN